ncbi:MAG: hypothetical protein KKA22_16460 [Gammaproteobacteria bacterium]|nr:hypothetical protein [Gammaproteobacteria bacterium]MBU1409730.1 hypothetical protein [Gammaproteobacteria bacterium]
MTKNTTEPGYKAVLVREETKLKLQMLGRALPNRNLFLEGRLATAAIEYCLNDETARQAMLDLVRNIVMRDLETAETPGP